MLGTGWSVPGGGGGYQEKLQDSLKGSKVPGWSKGEHFCWSQTRFPASITSKLVPLDAANWFL